MSGENIRQKVHQAVDQMTSAAKPDPWLAQKVRSRAQGKEEEPMRKKLPAGLIIVIAVLFMMTAVAAAVTNGFGLLRFYPEQAENTAFTDRIVPVGQTWEGEYFSAEIREAVFDGYKLRFNMSVTPKEGAEQVFVYPVAKAVCGDKLLYGYFINMTGWADNSGFWVPDMKPPAFQGDYDLGDMVYEVSMLDEHGSPTFVSEDAEWTITFDVLHTDWKVGFGDTGMDANEWSLEKWEEFQKKEFEAYDRHELLLDENGYGMGEVIQHPWIDVSDPPFEFSMEDPYLGMYTHEVFTLKEQAVFNFVADRAEVRKAEVPFTFALEDQEFEVTKAAATADGVTVLIRADYPDTEDLEIENLPWGFVLKLEEDELKICSGMSVTMDGPSESPTREVQYMLDYENTKPLDSVTVIPVQNTDSGKIEREDLAIVLELE